MGRSGRLSRRRLPEPIDGHLGFKIGDSWRSDMNEIRRLFRGTRKGLKPGPKIGRPKFGGSEGDEIVLEYH